MAEGTNPVNPDLIVYQLDRLEHLVASGFGKIDGRFDRLEQNHDKLRDRVTRLEVKAEGTSTDAEASDGGVTKVALGAFGLIGLVVGALAQGALPT